MCFGRPGDSSAEMRQQQINQQQRTNSGLQQINAIYGGGQMGVGRVDPTSGPYNPQGNYYTSGGAKFAGTPQQGSDMLGKGLLFSGSQHQAGFTPDFFKQRQQDYVNYAMPGLTQQYQKNLGDLTYSMAGRGLLNSSASQNLNASLNREMNTQKQGVADTGLQQSQALQQSVNQNKSNLIGQLEASGNPEAATQQALASAASFSSPSTFQPLGNLFSNWSNIYMANQANNNYQQSSQTPFGYGYGGGGYNRNVASPLPSVSRIVGG